ncbi:DHH family phosphoesterase [Phenylobacterium deserti]|uniref:Phosphoesterase n=1 Tax=Phenylobacterium deserti TaxID=1914756 RepID=A0A328AA49_9CAUL|nr:DHH family phosphoesterase [Phenylobacterium deserti]RAK51593.1 phosphoesterase [Phenylobacterium deserti]
MRTAFSEALDGFDASRPILLVSHNDTDGLSALAILSKALERAGRPAEAQVLGRGESPWSADTAARLRAREPGGVMLLDLGLRDGPIGWNAPTLVIDHHVPRGSPTVAAITGWRMDPIPTTSLLAWWCAHELTEADDLLWLAALGLVGDMAEDAGFAEMAEARRRYGVTALRQASSLLNAGRRSASGDAGPALALLLKGAGPKDVTSGRFPETEALLAAKTEVAQALDRAKRIGPVVRGGVALIGFSSACQIHPLVAQQWRGRLKNEIVLAANFGFRPGWVHFAARTARDIDLIEFLARHAPAGADENYGSGHVKATGGALRPADWNAFVRGLGFGPEQEFPQ